MPEVARKTRLFEGLVRLRNAEQGAPPSRDLVAVRTLIEEDLGETVSQRHAARILGVDHKALARWIRAGDLPVVPTPSGRTEVPVADLLELHEAVGRSRAEGTRARHHLEAVFLADRQRADELRPRDLVEGDSDGHGRAERRALAYHRVVAQRLTRQMVDDALRLLWKWEAQGRIDPRYAERWEQVLVRPLADVRRVIGEDSERARTLRQASPFAGALSEPERRRINEEIS